MWWSGSGHREVLLPPRGWGLVNLMAMASPAPTDSFPFTAKDLYDSAAMVTAWSGWGLKVQIWHGLVFESRSAPPTCGLVSALRVWHLLWPLFRFQLSLHTVATAVLLNHISPEHS